jgi:hypothetical protein
MAVNVLIDLYVDFDGSDAEDVVRQLTEDNSIIGSPPLDLKNVRSLNNTDLYHFSARFLKKRLDYIKI